MDASYSNWANSFTFTATIVHRPESLDELCAIVARTPSLHVLGTGHSFNGIADGAELLQLDRMPMTVEIDRDARTVTINPAIPYGVLAVELERAGLAVHNMASLPHITVGGAVATATHGSGMRSGNLATAVAAMELVTAAGDIVQIARGDAGFDGMVVHVGALGVVTRLTLDVEPTYQVCQEVFQDLAWDTLYADFDGVMGSAQSVSLFTDYGDTIGELWCKMRVRADHPWERRTEHFGARAATAPLHPVLALSADSCTEQLGVPGPWHERMPHFRMDAIPSAGHELQTEYMLARRHAVPAIQAIRALAPVIQPVLLISEIRTVASDQLWLSSAYGTDTVCLHFTWQFEPEKVVEMLPAIEAALAPFDPRPHWGKLFLATADELTPRYPKMDDFRALANRLDPKGKFRNAFLERHVFGE
ncbi:MAG: FAD-binding protein [Thermomicrobiales bacterium]|nr:FAD-binding protein [Thermomicrobiales bacterium]MCO5223406.1 FAD-binding protein [Thermomicrobiales bacterium]